MAKKFKYPVCYQVTAENQAEIVKTLLKMGYEWSSTVRDDYKKYPYIKTNYGFRQKYGGLAFVDETLISNCELITDLDLFYALAAMTENEKFFEDEYVVVNEKVDKENYRVKLYLNKILKIKGFAKYKNSGDVFNLILEDIGEIRPDWFRKATKEEIIQHF